MASSFGGTVKLTGESEYSKALKNINSNLKAVSSELKMVSTEFTNNGTKVGDLRTKNEALNKKLQEEQSIVKLCSDAIKDFTSQQTKNKEEIDKLKNSLESNKNTLEKMKNSTTATSTEISNQEKVVANLQKELIKSETAYDSNNRKINDYTVKMNNAKVECSDLSKQIQDNNSILSKAKNNVTDNAKSIKEFAEEEDKASNNTLKLGDYIKGNLISAGITSGIKGLANVMKSVGSTLINVGKQAIESYADYEQLIGGIETLFGAGGKSVEEYAQSVNKSVDEVQGEYDALITAQNKVIENSNNAYKTAGLSANQYMETVTSFSASLVSSLGGDTVKAAEIGNMAIIDMSDNANKMGTSMESIQYAYQGFAKQNYTMLDNLKLGYGGTKSEMERLLADAEKLTGIKYDISNLSDVYSAIHVIQGELGITGTTAKEASTTISGSINSMKSAWTNLITGVADDNANFSQLVSNFVDSLIGEDGTGGVIGNLLPRITIVMDGLSNLIVSLINTLLPQLLQVGMDLISNLVTGISTNLPNILTSVNQIISVLISGIITMLPQILQMGVQLIVSLVQGIGQQMPTLIPQMIDAVLTMVDTLLDNIDLIIDAGIQLLIGLSDGLIEALPKLIDKIPIIIDKLVIAITNNLPKIIEAGIQLTIKLALGIVQAIPQLVSKIPQIISSLVNGIANYYSRMFDIGKDLLNKVKDGIAGSISSMANVGKNIVQGLWNGINNAKDWVLDKIKGFGKSILNGIKSIFGIHSPSTVFRDEIGLNLAKGIGVGFEKEMGNVNDTIKKSLPTEFDLSSSVNLSNNLNNNVSGNNSYSSIIDAFREALQGMAFKIDGEKMGELIINDVERVIYS